VDLGIFDQAYAVAMQGQNIILAGGDGGDMAVARFNGQGHVDNTFGTNGNGTATVPFDAGGGNYDLCKAMEVPTVGKNVPAGMLARNNSGDYDFGVARLNPNGDLDTFSFGGGDGKTVIGFDRGGDKRDTAEGVALQSDGKIVVAGTVKMNATGN